MRAGCQRLLLLWFGLMLTGCNSCGEQRPANQPMAEPHLQRSVFFMDPDTIFTKTDQFTYTAELVFTLGQDRNKKVSRERIEIIGQKPQLRLIKSTDLSKSLTLFKQEDEFLVKDHNGPYHRVNNRVLYQGLLEEALNGLSWLMDQLYIDKPLDIVGEKIQIKNAHIKLDSPLIKKLNNHQYQYASITASRMDVEIVFDKKTGLPIQADIEAALKGSNGYWVTLRFEMAMKFTAREVLVVPEIVEEKPLSTPVNIVPRFNQLLEQGAR